MREYRNTQPASRTILLQLDGSRRVNLKHHPAPPVANQPEQAGYAALTFKNSGGQSGRNSPFAFLNGPAGGQGMVDRFGE
jgi:hypothetical protein